MQAKALKYITPWIFALVHVPACILLVASAYSDRISPEQILFFSYLGLAFPFIYALNIGITIYWAFLRRWKYLIAGLAALAICWNPASNYFPFHLKKDIPEENTIKVLTYNVMGFSYMTKEKGTADSIIRYIAASGADIVCIQEYLANNENTKKINNALDMYPHKSIVRLKNFGAGLALYSKYPILSSRRIEYPSKDNGSAIHLININGKTLTLINNHLESFKLTSKDKLHYLDFLKGARNEAFDGLRSTIQQKLGPAFLIRAKQARAVDMEIRKSESDYILVCGDFNDTPISYAHRKIQGKLSDAFARSGNGIGITYNLNYFWFRIDNILHSANMKAYRCTVDHVNYSDHYPLWCHLSLQP
ncbi:MAG: endonuclease/exonuclease/phosphatase family protein [Tannerellaceae bacterium]|jgi:endonuclease/exonuclease/phosphatase family metal-dependent hydrolase|nr:endonuclease/exonuclease/phosphatase family protein [Tannerellaceae bacterium]